MLAGHGGVYTGDIVLDRAPHDFGFHPDIMIGFFCITAALVIAVLLAILEHR